MIDHILGYFLWPHNVNSRLLFLFDLKFFLEQKILESIFKKNILIGHTEQNFFLSKINKKGFFVDTIFQIKIFDILTSCLFWDCFWILTIFEKQFKIWILFKSQQNGICSRKFTFLGKKWNFSLKKSKILIKNGQKWHFFL